MLNRLPSWLPAALVGLITLVVFAGVLDAGFVMWDDDVAIYRNPVLGGLSLQRLGWIFTDVDSTMRYIPLTLLGWSATISLSGLDPWTFHLGNWLLHGLNAALLCLVLARLVRRSQDPQRSGRLLLAASLGALLWSLHPLRVEPVAWANARGYSQALCLLLLSLLCYLRAAAPAAQRRRMLLAASVLLYGLSLLSHAIGLCLVLVLPILDAVPLDRLGGAAGWWRTQETRRVWLEKLPFLGAALAVGLITLVVRLGSAGIWETPAGLAEFGLLQRAAQAMYVWTHGLWRPLWPASLAPMYTALLEVRPLDWPFAVSTLVVLGVTATALVLRRRRPWVLAAWLAHLALLVPVLGLFEHPHYPADRYSLLAAIVPVTLIVFWLARTGRGPLRIVLPATALTVVVLLAALSAGQIRVWQDNRSLFSHTLSTLEPGSARNDLHCRFALALADAQEYRAAEAELRAVLAADPQHYEARFHLGLTLESQQRKAEAIPEYERAVAIGPDQVRAQYHLGRARLDMGQVQEAIPAFERAVALDPDLAWGHANLGIARARQGRLDAALKHLEQARRLRPEDPAIRMNLERVRRQLASPGNADVEP